MSWSRTQEGLYSYRGDGITALIFQEGELWKNSTHYNGNLVDCGEWESREAAFRNANTGIRRTMALRCLEDIAPDPFRDGDEDY